MFRRLALALLDYDTGLAIEVGYGVWLAATHRVQVGAELALPISVQVRSADDREPKLDYTSLDVDVLVGVRVGFR